MAAFTTVANIDEIPEGEAQSFAVNGRMIGVYKENGTYFAIDDLCPHMGASLCGGHVEDGIVACPWHAWRFRIDDGTWCDNPKIKVDSFEVRVRGDAIQVCVPERDPPESTSTALKE
ncbi:MAG: Rieske (2Fe-2S) protein [Pirellulaceae bacterium]|nr:Rieske (2Fe-2S) protein [Pirellulaceae bacterium]